MAVTMMRHESADSVSAGERRCEELLRGDEAEVLQFLSARPIHTVFLATLIRDNGLISARNRGFFYGCWDRNENLEGVGLIGHATIIEARTDYAVAAFAQLAAHSQNTNLIRGERKTVDSFWKHYAAAGQQPRLVCRELLFEKRKPSVTVDGVPVLRPARLSDLEHVLSANATMAFEEGGINPLHRDPEGFRRRTARRIEQGRVWIGLCDGHPVFKADIVGDTPEMIYLEGVHVNPNERGKGYGKRCLTHLASILFDRTEAICLTLNQRKANVAAFYARAGFDYHSEYETIYLR